MEVPSNAISMLTKDCTALVLSTCIAPDHKKYFIESVTECFNTLLNISLVCKDWDNWQKDEGTIVPIGFTQFFKYEIDFPVDSTCLGKIKIYLKSLNDLKGLFLECESNRKHASQYDFIQSIVFIQKLSKFKTLEFANWYFSKETNLTVELTNLIDDEKVNLVGKFLLFKPKFDVNKIAEHLSRTPLTMERLFLISLMVKLKYDMTEYFNASPHYVRELASIHLFNSCQGITVNDYKASGCNFSNSEKATPCTSIFQSFIPFLKFFYQNKSFQIPPVFNEDLARNTIKDDVLDKHIRKELFTEKDLEDYLVYLLTEAELNLKIICPAFGNLKEGTALSQLRQLGDSITQKPNAISSALAAYDQIAEGNSLKQSESEHSAILST